MTMRNLMVSVWIVLLTTPAFASGGEWIDLFDGQTLDGWEVHSGTATYKVEDGTIVGTAVLNSPNTFLCTKQAYGDFILEFDVKNDPELNSGVQFRSLIAGKETEFTRTNREGKTVSHKIPPDRVYGYQVEISNEQQEQAGNVYDEARRGIMLDDFSDKPEARAAFKNHTWNRYLVVCKGNSIRTWINGVPCAEFTDEVTEKGVIGLQVHSVPKKDFKPFEVRWRNIRLLKLN
jgi:hypothetical protein